MSDTSYWVALATTEGIGPRTFAALVERFGSPRAVFAAEQDELTQVARVTADIAGRLRATDVERIESELVTLADEDVSILTLQDERYPAGLNRLADAPPILFVRGALREQDGWSVAIVGTREADDWGSQTAAQLARGFAERGLTVVSGLARGIDTAAHVGALEAGGRTLAVLGSGIHAIHPRSNSALAENIWNGHGAVLSEFRPDAPPSGKLLMTRNRVISGLARGVVVVQAAPKSGSLDTAGRARRQARPVFAVRGGGPGTEQLIQSGAEAIDAQAIDWDHVLAALEAGAAEPPPSVKQMPLL